MTNVELYAPKPQSTFELAPVGQHKAILYGFVDMGTQDTQNMKGEDVKQRQVLLQFELHGKNAPMVDGKPPMYSKRLTYSMHEKATLRHIVEAITNTTHSNNTYGDGIAIHPAIGGCFMLQLKETDKKDGSKGRAIQAVMPVDPDAPTPERVNPIRVFSLDAFDAQVFESLPQKLQEVIQKSPEYAKAIDSVMSGEKPAIQPAVNEAAPFDDE